MPSEIRCYELFRGCSSRNVRQRGFQYVETFFKLRIGHNQRHQNAHDVAVGSCGDGDEALLVAILRDLFCFLSRRFARWGILDKFNRTHSAKATNFANDLKLLHPLSAALFEFAAKLCGARKQAFFFDDLESSQRGGTRERIPAKRSA